MIRVINKTSTSLSLKTPSGEHIGLSPNGIVENLDFDVLEFNDDLKELILVTGKVTKKMTPQPLAEKSEPEPKPEVKPQVQVVRKPQAAPVKKTAEKQGNDSAESSPKSSKFNESALRKTLDKKTKDELNDLAAVNDIPGINVRMLKSDVVDTIVAEMKKRNG